MSFCDHCQGQRFDRARVLRELRKARREWFQKHGGRCDAALAAALQAVRALDLPHLEDEDALEDEVVH